MPYTTDRLVSGFLVLKCDYLRTEVPHDLSCCYDCHTRGHFITVRPRDDRGLIDWFLGIEALVCCSFFDHVDALPHQWWIDRALEFGTTRIDMRKQPEPNAAYRASSYKSKARSKPGNRAESMRAALERLSKADEDAGMDAFLRKG